MPAATSERIRSLLLAQKPMRRVTGVSNVFSLAKSRIVPLGLHDDSSPRVLSDSCRGCPGGEVVGLIADATQRLMHNQARETWDKSETIEVARALQQFTGNPRPDSPGLLRVTPPAGKPSNK
jgi:hypothetical protein